MRRSIIAEIGTSIGRTREMTNRSTPFCAIILLLVGSAGGRELFMRVRSVMRIFAAACVLLLGRPLFAQEWDRYQNLDDRFAVTAPGQPTVEKIKWKSEYNSMFPATTYRWQQGQNRYAITVIDYSDSEAIYTSNPHSEDIQ